MLLWFIRVEFF